MTHKICYKIMRFKVLKITLICPHKLLLCKAMKLSTPSIKL